MKILFQGDSLTDAGRDREEMRPNRNLGSGYVNMICGRLVGEDPGAGYEIYNRGINGNRVSDLYGRWIEDGLKPAYDVLSILCGINDVGFGLRMQQGSDPVRFEFIYDRMLQEVREARPAAKLVLVEPFVVRMKYMDGTYGEDVDRDWDVWQREVRARGSVVRKLAEKYGAVFVPMMDLLEELCAAYPAEVFSVDCIHLTPAGNDLLARQWLKCVRAAGVLPPAKTEGDLE